MQAMHAAADTLHMPWLIPVMAICMFLALSGRLTLAGGADLYAREASREDNLLGEIGKLHPVWKTPAFALTVQAIIVTVMCFRLLFRQALRRLTGC